MAHLLLRVASGVLVALFLAGPVGAADVVFHEITDPSFVNRGPGADGRLGTADDNHFDDDPVTAALDLNSSGSASWIYVSDLPAPIPGGTDELIQFSRGSGSLRMVGMPPLLEGGLVEAFAFRAVDDFTRNPLFDASDLSPHAFQLFPGGSFLFAWSVRTCRAGDRDPLACRATVLENDVTGGGWIWPVDSDPRDLPAIGTFPIPGLPEYMEYLASITPPETTMLILAYIGPLGLTAENTRGEMAGLLIGGELVGFLGGYSTDPLPSPCPEPADVCGRSAELALVEKLVVSDKGRSRRKTGIAVEFGAGTWLGRADDGRVFGGTWKRSASKKRRVRLSFSGGAPLATLEDGAGRLAEEILGGDAPPIEAPTRIDLDLDRKSTLVRSSRAVKKSRVQIGRKQRKIVYRLKLSGPIALAE